MDSQKNKNNDLAIYLFIVGALLACLAKFLEVY